MIHGERAVPACKNYVYGTTGTELRGLHEQTHAELHTQVSVSASVLPFPPPSIEFSGFFVPANAKNVIMA